MPFAPPFCAASLIGVLETLRRRACRPLALLLGLAACGQAAAQEAAPLNLRVIGTVSRYSQYEKIEVPFWQESLPAETQGRVTANLVPIDNSGFRPEDMLRLVQIGLVSVASLPIALMSGDEPSLIAPDLPLMQDSTGNLRTSVDLWRPHLAQMLREQHRVELLAVHSYPAQVVFCAEPITTIADLAGRKVRVAGASQSELLLALGAQPVVVPFEEIRASLRRGQVSCAITGGQPGLELGLQQDTRYFYAVPVSWNLNLMIGSPDMLARLAPAHRQAFQRLLAGFEDRFWEMTAQATKLAPLCAVGDEACPPGMPRGSMTIVGNAAAERGLREKVLREHVLPAWARRCGEDCREPWNETIGKARGLPYPAVTD